MQYKICFHTGEGNLLYEGTLEEAKEFADDAVAYTTQDITIHRADTGEMLSVRTWYGTAFDAVMEDTDPDDVITFGIHGYYGAWCDL